MKRYSLILLFALFFYGIAQGQSLSVEAVAGPTLAYRILTTERSSWDFLKGERPIISYAGGLRAIYSFNESWSAGVGLGYARKGFSHAPIELTNDFGDPVLEPVIATEPKVAFTFLELPLFARYTIVQNEYIKFYAQSGLFTGFLLRERAQILEWPSGELKYVTVENSFARPVNVGLQAGAGLQFPVSGPWQIGVEPTLNSHLLSLHGDGPVKRWLFSFGINLLVNRAW